MQRLSGVTVEALDLHPDLDFTNSKDTPILAWDADADGLSGILEASIGAGRNAAIVVSMAARGAAQAMLTIEMAAETEGMVERRGLDDRDTPDGPSF